MAEQIINSFAELHEAIESFGKKVVVYRGQREIDWEVDMRVLIPPIYRKGKRPF